MKSFFSDLFFLLGPQRKKLSGIVIVFLVGSTLDLIGIGLVGSFVAVYSGGNSLESFLPERVIGFISQLPGENKLIPLGALLVVVFVIKAIISIGVQKVILEFSLSEMVRVRIRVFESIQQMSYQRFVLQNSVDYVQQITNYVIRYSSCLTALLRLGGEVIVALVIFILILSISSTTVLVMLGIGISLVVVFDRAFRRSLVKAGKEDIEGERLALKAMQEAGAGFKEIRVLGCENYFLDQVRVGSLKTKRSRVFSGLVSAIPRNLVEVAIILFVVTIVVIFSKGSTNPENIYPFIGMLGAATLRLGPITSLAIASFASIRTAVPSISSLRSEIEQLHSKLNKPSLEVIEKEKFRMIEFRELSFSYPNTGDLTLIGITLKVEAGETIGVIGPSGSGKTTLIDIMLGLLDHREGSLLYNGSPLKQKISAWHSKVAYLPQEVFLVDDSLASNIALGVTKESVNKKRLRDAVDKARLEELVLSLPEGLQTTVGERGVRLSGGQRQRVALARAFYHQREVLILDESTSSLDHDTEVEIANEIRILKGKKTLIVIAHRLTTIQNCDRIYKLERGQIVAQGTPAEVLSIDSI